MDSINNRLLNVNLNLEGQQKQTEKVEQKAAQEQPKTLAELESKFAKGEISAEEMKKQAEELGLKVNVKTNDVTKEVQTLCENLGAIMNSGASVKEFESEVTKLFKDMSPDKLKEIQEYFEVNGKEPVEPVPDKLFGTILYCSIILACCIIAIIEMNKD